MVFDASTLILLAKVSLLNVVASAHSVVITQAVQAEATRLDAEDSRLIARLIQERLIQVRTVAEGRANIRRLEQDFNIAEGEASSIWLARRLKVGLATDDRRAIKGCKALAIPFATALHFLVDCYRKGRIEKDLALAKLDRLMRPGRYHSRIIEHARSQLEGGRE